ncbi:hypothetical protein B0J12DRAFT_640016 [Macrophomina phaseolina]|uniref:Uncharacterized protein n=1 Tax=Macrophomina phaseolina TaxID=35725 RepID=A0ABQ8GVS3_9PEZI|nr:hypothetical protein B0J12DRAFT_640016 [Macrophomina phaseolina]
MLSPSKDPPRSRSATSAARQVFKTKRAPVLHGGIIAGLGLCCFFLPTFHTPLCTIPTRLAFAFVFLFLCCPGA